MADSTSRFAPIIADVRVIYGSGSIPLHRPVFEGNERQYLADCIDSNFVSSVGAKVTEFKDAAKAADTTASEEIAAAVDKMDIAKLNELAAAPEVISNTEQAAAAQGQRNTVMNGSFLRASLFSSVIAYGVSALVMGLGVMFLAIGFAFQRLAAAPVAPVAATRADTV